MNANGKIEKNPPARIFLQMEDLHECEWTWCEDQVHEDDVPYIRLEEYRQLEETGKARLEHLIQIGVWARQALPEPYRSQLYTLLSPGVFGG
jgi:hypothetical protein